MGDNICPCMTDKYFKPEYSDSRDNMCFPFFMLPRRQHIWKTYYSPDISALYIVHTQLTLDNKIEKLYECCV